MKRHYFAKIAILFIAITLCPLTSLAQRYEVDNLYKGFAKIERAFENDTTYQTTTDESLRNVQELPNGEIVTVTATFDNSYAVFDKDGRLFAISVNDLRFAKDNEEGTIDILAEYDKHNFHTTWRWLFTAKPFYVLLIILLCIGICCALALLTKGIIHSKMLEAIPILLVIATAMEAFFIYILGTDHLFWWADHNEYGFWGALQRIIPATIGLAMQLLTFFAYKGHAKLSMQFSIFVIIYTLSTIVALATVVIMVWKLLITLLPIIAIAIGLLFAYSVMRKNKHITPAAEPEEVKDGETDATNSTLTSNVEQCEA